jgi:hypothetical protein
MPAIVSQHTQPWKTFCIRFGTLDLLPFRTVARSFRQDYEAIRAALTTPWSTGQCEGEICRMKLLRSLGYGRVKVDLLGQRNLHRVPALAVPMKHHRKVTHEDIA